VSYHPRSVILRKLPSITQLIRGRSRVQTWASLIPLLASTLHKGCGKQLTAPSDTRCFTNVVSVLSPSFIIVSWAVSLGGRTMLRGTDKERFMRLKRKRLNAKLLIKRLQSE